MRFILFHTSQMNAIVWLGFELACYDVTVNYVSHSIAKTSVKNFSKWLILFKIGSL